MQDENTTVIVRLEKHHEYKLFVKVGLYAEIESQSFTESDFQNLISLFRNMLGEIKSSYGDYDEYKRAKSNKTEQQKINILYASIDRIKFFNSYFKFIVGERTYSTIQNQLANLIESGKKALFHKEEPVGRIIYEGNIRNFIPLDFLIVEGRYDSNNTFSNAILTLSRVVGFSFIVNRNPTKLNNCHIEYDKKLSINIYTDENVAKDKKIKEIIEEELNYFKNDDHYHDTVEKPRKYKEEYGNISRGIIKKLVSQVTDINIHHFCCHGHTSCSEDWGYHLIFGQPKQKDSPRAKLVELIHYCSSEINQKVDNSIVFLNACGSAVAEPNNFITFPKFFLEYLGAIGFVGTEYKLNTKFACDFSKVFYTYLLKTKNLDIALFKTRWYFAKKEIHILGLFYTLYGAPNLKLLNKANSINIDER